MKKKMMKKKIEKIESKFRCNTCNEPLIDITATKTHICMGNKVKWSKPASIGENFYDIKKRQTLSPM